MALTPQLSHALTGPDWLVEARRRAALKLESTPMPSAEQELWRYSRVAEIDLDSYQPAKALQASPDEDIADLMGFVDHAAATVVTVDGQITHHSIDSDLAGKGLVVAGPDGSDGGGFDSVAPAVDIFGVLNEAFTLAPIHIDIPSRLVVDAPIVVIHVVSSERVATFPRLTVHAGESSEASVYELHLSKTSNSLVVPVVQHDVEPAATLRYVNAQLLDTKTHHIGYNASKVARDANFSSVTIALGGDYARLRTDSHLVGKGADAKLQAAYFGEGNQMHDFRTLQQHDAPKSTSDLFFKGSIGDASRSVYSGLIRIVKGAAGTNAFQTNRNLVLSSGAHAESVPNLEIEESDVKCSHASAIGPIDEEHRYYLESRGVPTDIAERLIAKGFLNEVLDNVQLSTLRQQLSDEITAKLDRVQS